MRGKFAGGIRWRGVTYMENATGQINYCVISCGRCSIYGGELFDRAISDDFLLTEKACVCIVRQICEGVEFIHSQNIIHLDMKVEDRFLAASLCSQ